MSRAMMRCAVALMAAGALYAAGDADRGNEIFDEQCASCHFAYKADRKVGPSLKWLFSKGKLESNGKPPTEANVIDRIESGGKGMPAFKGSLSEASRADLIAYLKGL